MAKREYEIVYANIRTGYEKGRRYSNPRHFISPRSEATRVIVVGDWPRVVEAYQAVGIPVIQLEVGQPLSAADDAEPAAPINSESAAPTHDPSTVEIPEDLSDLSWPALRAKAKEITGENHYPKNKDEAIGIITSELDRRKLPPQE